MSWRKPINKNKISFLSPTLSGKALLAMIVLLAVQLCAQTFIHNALMFIDTSNNA